MEKRTEYDRNDQMVCPRCKSDELDCDEAPDEVTCYNCGLTFRLTTVAVWDDSQPVVPGRALQDCLPEKE
jgi:hypothetical protein